jgi:hypothetical protein
LAEVPEVVVHARELAVGAMLVEEALDLGRFEAQQVGHPELLIRGGELVGLGGRPRGDHGHMGLAVRELAQPCIARDCRAALLVEAVEEEEQSPGPQAPHLIEAGRVDSPHGVGGHREQAIERALRDLEGAQLDIDGDRCLRIGLRSHRGVAGEPQKRRGLARTALAEQEQAAHGVPAIAEFHRQVGERPGIAGGRLPGLDLPFDQPVGRDVERVVGADVRFETAPDRVQMLPQTSGCRRLFPMRCLALVERLVGLGDEETDHRRHHRCADGEPDGRGVERPDGRGAGRDDTASANRRMLEARRRRARRSAHSSPASCYWPRAHRTRSAS